MKLYNDLTLKFERPQWRNNAEFALIDTILEDHAELIELLSADILRGNKSSKFGRHDIPSIEQIVRAAIFKEMKNLDYRELQFAQEDSRICATFIKLDER
ncbi:MAG: ISNCY family transposase, partial [Bacteroidota bacterium]|nr:ISNCY family transposase [Bacteroidota bacterium]